MPTALLPARGRRQTGRSRAPRFDFAGDGHTVLASAGTRRTPARGSGGLRVLITNRILLTRTGTEVYVRDLAASLLRRGHLPIVYSPHLGEMAAEIRAGTVPVVDDLARVGAAPDIIHGHHGLETLAALLAFPGVPAVAVCHSWLGWPDAPVIFPRVARYLAVDQTCRDRLVFEHGAARGRASRSAERGRPGPVPAARPAARRGPRARWSSATAPAARYLRRSSRPAPPRGIAVDVAGYRARHGAGPAAGRARPATISCSPRARRRSRPRPSAPR